jgi:hypothetical protein
LTILRNPAHLLAYHGSFCFIDLSKLSIHQSRPLFLVHHLEEYRLKEIQLFFALSFLSFSFFAASSFDKTFSIKAEGVADSLPCSYESKESLRSAP